MTRALLPSNYITNEGTLVEGFEAAGDWTSYGVQATGAALTANTTDYHSGTQSLTFSATGTGNVRRNKYIAAGIDMSDGDTFSLWVKWDRASTSSNMTIYMSSDAAATLSNYKAITLLGAGTGSNRRDGSATCITWKKSEMTISGGTLDWSAVTNINVLVNCQAANESCSLDSLYFQRRTRPKLVMCFDDGVESTDFSQIDAAAIALARGVPVSFGIIPRLVGGTGYLTWDEIATLSAAGHFITTHSDVGGLGDYPAAGYTAAEVLDDIQEQQAELRAQGYIEGATYFIWPGGKYEGYDAAFSGAGLKMARSTSGLEITNINQENMALGLLQPGKVNASAMTDTPAELLGYVDRAIAAGTSIFFYVHKISSGAATPDTYEITGDDFTSFCDGVETRVQKGLIDPMTMKSFYEGLTTPRRLV